MPPLPRIYAIPNPATLSIAVIYYQQRLHLQGLFRPL